MGKGEMIQSHLEQFHSGKSTVAYSFLGAHLEKSGCVFRVYAPHAKEVFVVGRFNSWMKEHPMDRISVEGTWELFVPGIQEYETYKYLIIDEWGGQHYKADPYAYFSEAMPATASRVFDLDKYEWEDSSWMEGRGKTCLIDGPLNIYEVHLGSWKRNQGNVFPGYDELSKELVRYVKEMGYTHIELMPICEYPYGPSWGYQVTGYYAATSRYGTPDQLMMLIDACHREGIGVFLDWVPGHFPKDAFGLYRFDGKACYEYEDDLKGQHRRWGTAIFDWGRPEVKSFLISNACFWLEKFHFDGLRVDAVSSMLYLDYDRGPGEWRPNIHGGIENLEAINFLKELNAVVKEKHPGTVTIAEESTAWPYVTKPLCEGGLGFDLKWNMGWMNDTLRYMSLEPGSRYFTSGLITFSLTYAFSENFVLPFSHDEVVHLKKSLFSKMIWGEDAKFANLRALMGFMIGHPGKKLLFMGGEIAQPSEWSFDTQIPWEILARDKNKHFQEFVRNLNFFYLNHSALWECDYDWTGFRWISVDRAKYGIMAFRRFNRKGEEIVVVANFSDQPLYEFKLSEHWQDRYRVVFSTHEHLGAVTVTGSNASLPAFSTGFFIKEVL